MVTVLAVLSLPHAPTGPSAHRLRRTQWSNPDRGPRGRLELATVRLCRARPPCARLGEGISTRALLRGGRRLVLLLLAAAFLAVVPAVAGAEDTVAFTIKDARITESSGLAVDPDGNVYWTVNDSGDRGVAYGIGLDGKVQGTLNFRAQPQDVEAVAVHEDRLYVADIGDKSERGRLLCRSLFHNPTRHAVSTC